MGKTLTEIDNLPSSEIVRWQAIDEVMGIPDPWEQTALICQTIAAAHGSKTKLDDWKPIANKKQSGKEIAWRMKRIAARQNKAVNKHK